MLIRLVSILSVFMILFQVGISSVGASSGDTELSSIPIEKGELSSELLLQPNNLDDLVYPDAYKVSVFWKEFLVAVMIGGVIIYQTGQSAEDWVARGLDGMENTLRRSYNFLTEKHLRMNIYVNTFGSITYRCAPNTTCPIHSSDPEETI